MNGFIRFFHVILWQPLFNLLILFYLWIPNLGIAIILLTLLIRIVLYPLQQKAAKSQIALQAIQPKLKEIQREYKDNREEQAKRLMALYKEEKINPLSGFVVLLIQFPILIVMFYLFRGGISEESYQYLYSFVSRPETINAMFLKVDLNEPYFLLAILAGLTFFLQTKISAPKKDKKPKTNKGMFGEMFQKQMMYVFPIFFAFILTRLPAALSLYLVVSGVFTVIQQYFVKKKYQEEKNVSEKA